MKKFLLLTNLLISFVVIAQDWSSINFDVTDSNCDNATMYNQIFISEIYDCQNGGYGVIELYNPTDNPITLTNFFKLKKYAIPGTSFLTIDLVGIIQPHSTFVFVVNEGGSSSNSCLCPSGIANQSTNNTSMGFNAQDKIELLRLTTIIDTWIEVNNTVGYSYSRKPSATVPKVIHDANDWYYTNQGNNTIGCSDLGTNIITPVISNIERFRDSPPTIPNTFCDLPTTIRITMETLGPEPYNYNLQGINTGFIYNGTNPVINNVPADNFILTVTGSNNCLIEAEFLINPSTTTITPIQTNI